MEKGKMGHPKEYKDNRNWKEYNEELIHRGELYLSLEFIKNWNPPELDKNEQ